jgi:hypothetical protein
MDRADRPHVQAETGAPGRGFASPADAPRPSQAISNWALCGVASLAGATPDLVDTGRQMANGE